MFAIRRAHQVGSAIFSSHLAEHNLTSAQYFVMCVLQNLRSTSQNELGRLAHMDRCTISMVVRNLKTRKIVGVRPDLHDGRKAVIELTAQGRELLGDAMRLSARAHWALFSVLTDAERRQLMRTLKKLVGAHAAQFPAERLAW